MKIDSVFPPIDLAEAPVFAGAAEEIGLDALWSSETQHDPFLPLALMAQATSTMSLGTAVAIAFARSPATVAYTAWDLAKLSGGRFILGLGTQVRPHIERRFGMPWPESPIGKLREFVAAVRALWSVWQSGGKLNQRGEYYRLSLMTPFFNPGPIDWPEIPIYLAGVNPGMCRLAGEIAQGFHAHPLHSIDYLEQVVRPALAEGMSRTSMDPAAFELAASVFVVSDDNEELLARGQIAFYASTPSYRPVFEFHGWGDVAEQLSGMARRAEWNEMPWIITDEMLETFAVVADRERLATALQQRYVGHAERLIPYTPFRPGVDDGLWQGLIQELHKA